MVHCRAWPPSCRSPRSRSSTILRTRADQLRVDGEVAGQLVYRTDGTRRTLVHTEIDPAFEGQGLGSHLAAGALDDARQRGFTVVPLCPFVTAYLVATTRSSTSSRSPTAPASAPARTYSWRSRRRGRSSTSSRQAGRGGGPSSRPTTTAGKPSMMLRSPIWLRCFTTLPAPTTHSRPMTA